MRAIIVAANSSRASEGSVPRCLTAMLPLLDRPFLQHVVEYLVANGFSQIDFVLSQEPERIEARFGSGDRWGTQFHYHLAKDPTRPYKTVRMIFSDSCEMPILLVHSDRLPIDTKVCQCPVNVADMPTTFVWSDSGSEGVMPPLQGTGWMWLLSDTVKAIPADLPIEDFDAFSMNAVKFQGALVEVAAPLRVRTYSELLEAHRRVLNKDVLGLLTTGREVESGVWLSRDVGLPASVKVTPPVYLGAHTRIGENVALGPNVVVGEGSVIDRDCVVMDSLIFPGSYVGESLELADLIVDRNRVVNTRVGGECLVSDDFIIGTMAIRPIGDWMASICSRMAAAGLLILLWPLLLLTAAYRKLQSKGPVCRTRDFVHLPASSDASRWTTYQQWSFSSADEHGMGTRRGMGGGGNFLMDFMPALVNIVRGELRFVGVAPRNTKELEELPSDWRELVLQSKVGMITEAFVRFGPNPTKDEMYSAEAYYAVHAGIGYDLKLLLAWLGKLLRGKHMGKNLAELDKTTGYEKQCVDWPEEDSTTVISTLETNSDIRSLDEIRAFVTRICREELDTILHEDEIYKVVLAVQEAASNVMRHAYHGASDGKIRFDALVKESRLSFRIFHWGNYFEPGTITEPSWDETRTGGFGLYIISRYVDDIQYFHNEEGAHCVALTINLSGGPNRGSSIRENWKRDHRRVAVRED